MSVYAKTVQAAAAPEPAAGQPQQIPSQFLPPLTGDTPSPETNPQPRAATPPLA
jgi:hypothetical protein